MIVTWKGTPFWDEREVLMKPRKRIVIPSSEWRTLVSSLPTITLDKNTLSLSAILRIAITEWMNKFKPIKRTSKLTRQKQARQRLNPCVAWQATIHVRKSTNSNSNNEWFISWQWRRRRRRRINTRDLGGTGMRGVAELHLLAAIF